MKLKPQKQEVVIRILIIVSAIQEIITGVGCRSCSKLNALTFRSNSVILFLVSVVIT